MNEKFLKKTDITLLILFPVISVVFSLWFKTNYLTSILLFFGLPSFWLSFRTPKKIAKTFLFSLFTAVPIGFLLDYVAVINNQWFVPSTIFSFRVMNIVPVEDFIWAFFLVYVIIIFYEHFLDKGKHELIDRKMKYIIWPLVVVLIVFFTILSSKPELLVIKYFYLWFGTILLFLPSITFLSFFPRLFSKYIKTTSYIFSLSFLFEMTSVKLGQWVFPANDFIGWIELFGIRFPFEEFFFWFIMTTVAVLSYYEFFDDDLK